MTKLGHPNLGTGNRPCLSPDYTRPPGRTFVWLRTRFFRRFVGLGTGFDRTFVGLGTRFLLTAAWTHAASRATSWRPCVALFAFGVTEDRLTRANVAGDRLALTATGSPVARERLRSRQ